MQIMITGCTLINVDVDGATTSVGIEGGRIRALDEAPAPCARVIDARGDRVLPGLINAHDHLQLNNYPRIRFRERHANAREWVGDIDSRRHTDARLARCALVPRETRLFHGALKNLLCGVTTVAHHDPWYEPLDAADFPIRVPAGQGWAHSLYLDGDEAVRESFARTAADRPWVIHAGEGVDAEARGELDHLDGLGCLRENTVLVHGVGFDARALGRLHETGASLVWCPSSNFYLFGRTADVERLAHTRALAVGSDSRLSGERDLLEELRVAAEVVRFDEARLMRMVTEDAARVLRLPDRGRIAANLLADLLVLPRGLPLVQAKRADVRAVLVNGEFIYGDADYAESFDAEANLEEVSVDCAPKRLLRSLARRIFSGEIVEPGVAPAGASWRVA